MKKTSIILFLCMLFFAAGCWDIRDVSNRAIVTAIGVDKGQVGESNYRVTVEIISPKELKSGSSPATIIETVEGASIGQAIERLQATVSRTVNLDHFRVLFVGEEQSREDFRDIISYFEKNPHTALRFKLGFVQQGRAEDILRTKPRFSNSIAGEYVEMSEVSKGFSLAHAGAFYTLLQDLRSSKGNGLSCRVTEMDQGKLMIRHGGAVFKNWRLVGWLSDEEIQAANWILGKGKATIICERGNGVYTYAADRKTVHITPQVDGNKNISFKLKVNVSGDLIEDKGVHLDLSKAPNVENLEKALAQTIATQLNQAVDKSQKYFGVDYLGLDKELKKKEPRIIKGLNWAEIYPQVPVKVVVDAKIDTYGFANK